MTTEQIKGAPLEVRLALEHEERLLREWADRIQRHSDMIQIRSDDLSEREKKLREAEQAALAADVKKTERNWLRLDGAAKLANKRAAGAFVRYSLAFAAYERWARKHRDG